MGVAGGELLIPAIVLLLRWTSRLPGSLSLAISLPTMLVAFARYSRDRSFEALRANKRFVFAMASGSIIGSIGGGFLLGAVPSLVLIPFWSPCCSRQPPRSGATSRGRVLSDFEDPTPRDPAARLDAHHHPRLLGRKLQEASAGGPPRTAGGLCRAGCVRRPLQSRDALLIFQCNFRGHSRTRCHEITPLVSQE
jgi:hypothetical protein